ncbi:MAG: FmdB family zinc ribbon protein [Phycisphaeraceae bacterium]
MPTYDYRCDACGHEFEAFQSMSARPKKKCPECGKMKLNRLIGTGAGIIFKGSGFYETDYRSDSYRKAARADRDSGKTDSAGSSNGESKTSSAGKSESKPAASSSAKSD